MCTDYITTILPCFSDTEDDNQSSGAENRTQSAGRREAKRGPSMDTEVLSPVREVSYSPISERVQYVHFEAY